MRLCHLVNNSALSKGVCRLEARMNFYGLIWITVPQYLQTYSEMNCIGHFHLDEERQFKLVDQLTHSLQ